jgi:HAD superfamily hydrolase (TIGR01450 family)
MLPKSDHLTEPKSADPTGQTRNRLPTFFIDIDGVLYSGMKVIAGGPAAIEFLRTQEAQFCLLTNTSRMSLADIEQQLTALGYDISRKEIIAVPEIAAEYLSHKFGTARCFIIGDRSLDKCFTRYGHQVTRKEEPVDVVVIGLSRWADFREIDVARRLVEAGAEPVALNRDPTCPDGDVLRIGAGPVVAALESVISCPVTVIGKPSAAFFDAALRRTGFYREDTIMLGDSLKVDIIGAAGAGLRTILVRSGASSNEPLPPECDWELSSIAELPSWYTVNFGQRSTS